MDLKRFIVDAMLICILVSIGAYVTKSDPTKERVFIEQEVSDFEDEIAQNHVVKPKHEPVSLNDIEDNQASKLAKKSSEFVVGTVKGTLNFFSDFFDNLTN